MATVRCEFKERFYKKFLSRSDPPEAELETNEKCTIVPFKSDAVDRFRDQWIVHDVP